jgi:flagellar basal body-associated protein FliL
MRFENLILAVKTLFVKESWAKAHIWDSGLILKNCFILQSRFVEVCTDEGRSFMRKSIIYLFVALTLVSLGLALVPSAFSQTQNIKIVSYSYYIDNLGFLDVVGEVQNVGSNTVASVILTGTVYSTDGTDQADSYTQAWVKDLTPQQKAPFYMDFYAPNNSPDGTWLSVVVSNVALTVSQAEATASYQYPDLKVTSSSKSIGSSTTDKGVCWVTGTVQNTGSQTAQNITVFGTFYNSTGSVVAVGYSDTLTPANLASSGTASFKLGAFDLNQTLMPSNEKISSYSLLIQALGPILQGTAPTQSPGGTSSNSSNPALIYAIIVVIVILGIAGTILVLRKRKPQETKKAAQKATEKTTKKARPKRMVEILPRAFFSKPQGTTSRRNVAIV